MFLDDWARKNKMFAGMLVLGFFLVIMFLDNRLSQNDLILAICGLGVVLVLSFSADKLISTREKPMEELIPIVNKRLLHEPVEQPEGIQVTRVLGYKRRIVFNKPCQIALMETANTRLPMLLVIDAFTGKIITRIPEVEPYIFQRFILSETFNLDHKSSYQSTRSDDVERLIKKVELLSEKVGLNTEKEEEANASPGT